VRPDTPARIALLGAFPFPYPQGSQIFVADQARALAQCGAEPLLHSYGRGEGEPPCGLALAPSAGWTSPRAMRSGPQWGKPLADVALLATYLRSAGRQRFDAVLAHNAEAALIALAARARTGVPVVYVAHTILRHELSAYGPARLRGALDRVGGALDRAIARRVDGAIALCEEARAELSAHARGPIAVIPPGLDPAPAPEPSRVRDVCAAHGLTPGRFVLYSGNLDGYQDLALLGDTAHRLGDATPVVIATHDRAAGRAADLTDGGARRRARVVVVDDYASMRALCHAARVLVLTRRREGGFPIKLLNYMETGRPIVAFRSVAIGLEHGESAWLLEEGAGAEELAAGILTLCGDAALCERLGRGARQQLETCHAWPELAARTLAFVGEVRRRSHPQKAR
jgi:glycosyltransferase involved in cell wall biosynthesis